MKLLRIYDYMQDYDPAQAVHPPIAVNYKTGLSTRLAVTNTFVKGELVEVIFSDPETDKPVVREQRTFIRNELGLVERREMTIAWYYHDGTRHTTTKSFPKTYSRMDSVTEAKRRRSNMVEAAISLAISLLGADAATLQPAFQSLAADKAQFIETGDTQLITTLTSWDFPEWTAEIATAVVAELTL